MSTSDDKSIRIWDFGLAQEYKYIAEPHMHAIAHVSKSYDGLLILFHSWLNKGNWLLCQSADNQILVFNIREKFRMNRKKVFKGHNTAGYGCGVTLSPDGRYPPSPDLHLRLDGWQVGTQTAVLYFGIGNQRRYSKNSQLMLKCLSDVFGTLLTLQKFFHVVGMVL